MARLNNYTIDQAILTNLCVILAKYNIQPTDHPSQQKGYIVFFFFLFLAAPWHIEFPGQGSDMSHSCDLCPTPVAVLDP